MIITKGWGVLAGILLVIVLLGVQYSTSYFFNDPTYYQTHKWPMIIGAFIAGVITYPIGKHFNKTENKHTLFWIPVQHLIIAFPIIGTVIAFIK